MLPLRKLVKMPHVEPHVPVAIKPRHLLNLGIGRALLRDPPNPTVRKTCMTLVVKSLAKPQKMARAAPKDQRRVRAAQATLMHLVVNFRKSLHP
jgi:hypothetical protein